MEMINMDKRQYYIDKLQMIKHPEGGYYKETYRSDENISDRELSVKFEGTRPLATSIYFLLNSGEVSHFHRIKSDELWYFHDGAPLSIYVIDNGGNLVVHRLGLDIDNGEVPQVIVPKGTIFGAALNEKNQYTLVGCMVSQGFEFRDFKLFTRQELLQKYPEHSDLIIKLT
jgi:predicted cupin superfamily sugar epimerase